MSSPTSSTTSYWCYSCTRFVRAWPQDNGAYVSCPYCDGGFIEEIEAAPRSDDHGRRFPLRHDSHRSTDLGSRRSRRGAGDRSPFNPVVVLRGPSDGEDNTFELYYDDGSGSGLRPLPASISAHAPHARFRLSVRPEQESAHHLQTRTLSLRPIARFSEISVLPLLFQIWSMHQLPARADT